MRSRADRTRPAAEWLFRGLALGLLAWSLVAALWPSRVAVGERVDGAGLAAALPRWSLSDPTGPLRVVLDSAPAPLTRDWLAALRGAGSRVSWSVPRIVPLAVSAEPAATPRRAVTVRVAAPAGSAVSLGDAAGLVDSARAAAGGVSLRTPAIAGAADVSVGVQHARTRSEDSLIIRPVLLLATAGWEGKFAAAALEEDGWEVEARFRLAPGSEVRQGALPPIDTANYSALILLDSAAASAPAAAAARFARAGGGLVLAGTATRVASLAALAPGTLGAPLARARVSADDSLGTGTVDVRPILALRADASAIEHRDGSTVVALRRVTAGRVALTGYVDSWRWRMSGAERGAARHRSWWSSIVSAVAYAPAARSAAAPASPAEASSRAGAAPIAGLLDALGPPESEGAEAANGPRAEWWREAPPRWTLALVLLLLLAEWGSRRLRGVR